MNKLDKKWQLKIVCLLLAIVLWFVIINEQNPLSEGSYTVPITVENLDSQYITSNVPKTVYVACRARAIRSSTSARRISRPISICPMSRKGKWKYRYTSKYPVGRS